MIRTLFVLLLLALAPLTTGCETIVPAAEDVDAATPEEPDEHPSAAQNVLVGVPEQPCDAVLDCYFQCDGRTCLAACTSEVMLLAPKTSDLVSCMETTCPVPAGGELPDACYEDAAAQACAEAVTTCEASEDAGSSGVDLPFGFELPGF